MSEYSVERIQFHGTPFIVRTKSADKLTYEMAYYKGYWPARYPVPAVIVRTGYEPSGTGAMFGVPYIWVSGARLWTFWKKTGLVEQWYDRDGRHQLRRYVNHRREG